MSKPTRQEIIDAHEALSNLAAFASRYAEDMVEMNQTLDWNETIKAALPPKPQPTMAEVEWDSDKHFLTEAEHPASGKVIMVDTVFTPRTPTFMSSQLTRTRPTAFSQPPATSPRPASATHSQRCRNEH